MSNIRIAIPVTSMRYVANYANAVEAVGMEPVVVTGFSGADCDGLLLPGGVDINPIRYGQENQGSVEIEDELDALQFCVLDAYVKAKKPVFGICRGLQLINVYFGGTLIQDLPTAERHSRCGGTEDKVHECNVNEGSFLAAIYGTHFSHNSSHHQAADRIGTGLIVDSVCDKDGVVESIHHAALPIYAVQWHPERMCLANERTDTVDGLPIFEFIRKTVSDCM
jgi:putative glutamine amidotransferase